MVDELEMPFAFAGFEIDCDKGLAEKTVAQPVAAVFVDRRAFHSKVNQSGFRIGGDLRPDTVIAGPFPRPVFPAFVPEFTGIRNRVEAPELLARAGVKGA